MKHLLKTGLRKYIGQTATYAACGVAVLTCTGASTRRCLSVVETARSISVLRLERQWKHLTLPLRKWAWMIYLDLTPRRRTSMDLHGDLGIAMSIPNEVSH